MHNLLVDVLYRDKFKRINRGLRGAEQGAEIPGSFQLLDLELTIRVAEDRSGHSAPKRGMAGMGGKYVDSMSQKDVV